MSSNYPPYLNSSSHHPEWVKRRVPLHDLITPSPSTSWELVVFMCSGRCYVALLVCRDSALIGRTGQISWITEYTSRVLWWAASWPEKSFAEAVLKLQRVALDTRRGWGACKWTRQEMHCWRQLWTRYSPGISVFFWSVDCSIGIRGEERCDWSWDDLIGSCKKQLKGHVGSIKSGR